ncbi:hypothetical protein NPIL_591321 [Nephila pilipes]|uniref:Uncharacterized protein n=1 Tax=Nephila pilipes TaxID=299642 RepID=A0A8X6QSD7_NEPPI|nr:hypothetical protein NPIL_591321 [Nephila pilipes]
MIGGGARSGFVLVQVSLLRECTRCQNIYEKGSENSKPHLYTEEAKIMTSSTIIICSQEILPDKCLM